MISTLEFWKINKLKKEHKTLWLSHGTRSYIRMCINAVAGSVMLYLRDFYNIIFKIKHKLYMATQAAPPPQRTNSGCAPEPSESEVHLLPTIQLAPFAPRRKLTPFISLYFIQSFVKMRGGRKCNDTWGRSWDVVVEKCVRRRRRRQGEWFPFILKAARKKQGRPCCAVCAFAAPSDAVVM
jgi:hypothetical protein